MDKPSYKDARTHVKRKIKVSLEINRAHKAEEEEEEEDGNEERRKVRKKDRKNSKSSGNLRGKLIKRESKNPFRGKVKEILRL